MLGCLWNIGVAIERRLAACVPRGTFLAACKLTAICVDFSQLRCVTENDIKLTLALFYVTSLWMLESNGQWAQNVLAALRQSGECEHQPLRWRRLLFLHEVRQSSANHLNCDINRHLLKRGLPANVPAPRLQ